MCNNYSFTFLFWIIIAGVGLPHYNYAQKKTLNSYIGFHFKSPKKKVLKLSFEQHNNLIVIPIKINGLDTLNFVLDTGVGYTLLTDPDLLEQLHLPCLRKIGVAGTGVGEELTGCITNINLIEMRGIKALHHSVIVLEEDVLQLSRYAGVKIHGLIGYDLFSKFVVKINYLARKLVFYNPKTFEYKGKGEEFPISIEQMKPYIKAEALLAKGTTPLKLILDTGAGHSLSLDRGTHPNIQVPEKHIPTQLGMTLNGAVQGVVGRIQKFTLGSYELPKVITSFPDSTSLRFVKGAEQRQGNLGCGVLKRFKLIFDYTHKKLILKPNRQFKEPFEFNTSGLDIVAEGEDYSIYKIGNIRPDSPAYKAGLQKKDQIIAIDDQIVERLTMNHIYKLVNKKEGKKTLLFIKRTGQYYLIELELEDPF